MIPVQMRAGGAFIALAVVLTIFALIEFISGSAVFTFTPGEIMICLAALLFGAFITVGEDGQGERGRVVAQLGATLLIVGSFFVPDTPLFATQTYWLVLWAGAAVVCALVLRRSAAS